MLIMGVRVMLVLVLCYILLANGQFVHSSFLAKILNENGTSGITENFIPTINARNALCKNQSSLYLQELKNYKVWAVEMFDATTKFPSGFLFGDSYDFGNFDECVELRVPYEDNSFTGKYCMAKLTIIPPGNVETLSMDPSSNSTMWNKINAYLGDPSKIPRNELSFAFCMPSSCTPDDLQETLLEVVEKFNQEVGFKLEVEVDVPTCQVKKELTFDTGDIIFTSCIILAIIFVTLGTLYDKLLQNGKQNKSQGKGFIHDALMCFSLPRNFKRLVTVSKDVDGLNGQSGIKVYSMWYIILLHRCMFNFSSAMSNPQFMENIYPKFILTFLLNGTIIVDSFFTMSGFLAAYICLCQFHQKKDNIVKIYIHRYIRMVSVYWILLLYYSTLFVKLGTGPLWGHRIEAEKQRCRKTWWANLLFINNYYDTENYCFVQSWYMAVDMQGFLFVPFLSLLLYRKPKIGMVAVIACIACTIVASFLTVYVNDELPAILIYPEFMRIPMAFSTFHKMYVPSHIRLGPYFVGILAGYLKYRMNLNPIKISKLWIGSGWIISGVLCFLSVYLLFPFYGSKMPISYSALYGSLHHVGYGLSVAWLLVVTSTGYAHSLNRILSRPFLVILGRLNYSVYLCHAVIQLFTAGTMRHSQYSSVFHMTHSMFGDVFMAYTLAFLLTLFFESPLIGMEKLLWPNDKPKTDVKTSKEIQTGPSNAQNS